MVPKKLFAIELIRYRISVLISIGNRPYVSHFRLGVQIPLLHPVETRQIFLKVYLSETFWKKKISSLVNEITFGTWKRHSPVSF